MCKDNQHLKFCTCKEIDKTLIANQNPQPVQDLPADNIVWTLAHYLGRVMSLMMGMPARPATQLGETMTQSYVLSQINAHQCFDFDYTPQEGDNLSLQNQYGFMSFIYRGNSWEARTYDPFLSNLEQFADGKVNCKMDE